MVDYSKKFLQSVEITPNAQGLTLRACGESIRFDGQIFSAQSAAELENEVSVEKSTLCVECTAKTEGKIEEFHYFEGKWTGYEEYVVAGTHLSGIGVFLRTQRVSFFLSLDFPYSKIDDCDGRITIGCDPLDEIAAGEKYAPHTLTVGACLLTGEKVGAYDRAEIEAFSEYILARMPEKFQGDRPIYTMATITNRMCDVREGRIFYSMADNPTLRLDLETLKEEVQLTHDLGMEYCQVFEGYFDWEEDGSTEKNLKELMAFAKPLNVRVGDYITALELNCWHYNYYDRHVEDKSLCAMDGNGNRYYLCYGNQRVVDMLEDTIVQSIIRNGEEMICIDGNAVVPCNDTSHGHNAGSYYALIRGMTRFMSLLNNVSPYFMTWTNAGNWLEFMPKLLWYNPNVYLTDPHARAYYSSLNALKYQGDCRREQMVTIHNKYFVPYVAYTNCEYYAFKHSRVADPAFFEYSFLQGLAVTPNICLGELRVFLNHVPAEFNPHVKRFIKKWLALIKENIDSWRYVYQLGDSPNAGANEAYAHINKDHGFICFVNQNNTKNSFTFTLDGSIGLENTDKKFILSEIYPQENFLTEQNLSGSSIGEKFTVEVPAYSVRILKIQPYFKAAESVRLFGINGKVEEREGGLCIELSEECGRRIPAAIYCEDGQIHALEVKTAWNVGKYYFPSELQDVQIDGNGARFILRSPRDYFQREIGAWRVDNSEQTYDLNCNNSAFCGGYIHNFYKENQRMYLTVGLGEKHSGGSSVVGWQRAENPVVAPPKYRASVYEAVLDIPFIENLNVSLEYGYDEVLELVFTDCDYVKSIKAKLDGVEVPVLPYRCPTKKEMLSYYIELVGVLSSGTKPILSVEVEWKETESERDTDFEKENLGGAQVI